MHPHRRAPNDDVITISIVKGVLYPSSEQFHDTSSVTIKPGCTIRWVKGIRRRILLVRKAQRASGLETSDGVVSMKMIIEQDEFIC